MEKLKRINRSWFLVVAIVLLVGCCGPCRTYQKQQRPLVGTEWQLVQLNGRKITPEGESYTLRFTEGGELQGLAACNRLMGSYTTAKDRSLQIGPLASTRMLCRDPHESEFIGVLERATHYDMDGPMMLLLSNGSLVAIFQSLPADKSDALETQTQR